MAKYQFTTPVGATYEVEAPDTMSEEEVYNQFIGQVQQYEDQANKAAGSTVDQLSSTLEAVRANAAQEQKAREEALPATIDDILARTTSELRKQGEAGALKTTEPSGAIAYNNTGTNNASTFGIPQQVADIYKQETGIDVNEAANQAQDKLQQQAREPFMEEAKKKLGTENYKGMTQTQIADALATADYQKKSAQAVATVATLPITGGASLLGRVLAGAAVGGGTTLAGQAAESASLGENKFNTDELRTGTIFGAGAGAAAPLVSRAIGGGINAVASSAGRVGESLRNILPRALGGNTAEEAAASRIASSANQDYLNRVIQGGDTEAQQAFRTATTDEAGNSILTPTQVFNDTGRGARFRAAEERSLNNAGSDAQARYAAQAEGTGFQRAADGTADSTLQRAAQNASEDFKKTANELYTTSKASAQSILDENNIKQIKFPSTKQVAEGHLASDAELGRVNLNSETRRTLNQFGKAKINSIDDLDQWKRTLSEKAAKAGRNGDTTSQAALRDTLNSLRNEADSTIQSINPNAGSLYREADQYFRQGIEDFGNKSILGRIADRVNPDTAPNILLRGQNAAFNTRQAAEALGSRLDNTSTNQVASDLARGIGQESRNAAFEAATRSGDFNPNVYQRQLLGTMPQAQTATELSQAAQAAGGQTARNEAAINKALRDAAETISTRGRAVSTSPLGNLLDLASGIGGAFTAGPAGLLAGLGTRVARQAWTSGMIDRLVGTNARAARYADFLSVPENAQQVLNVLNSRANRATTADEVINVIDSVSRLGTRDTAAALTTPEDGVVQQQVQSQQPSINNTQERTQIPTVVQPESTGNVSEGIASPSTPISQRNEALYNGLVHAETGGIENPWIRTNARDASGAGESSAFGPAQMTGTLVKDMMSRYGDQFTDQEKEYAKYFEDQATVMLAKPNDPVYGYGKEGVLGKTPEMRQLYGSIARKIINILDNEVQGDYQQLIRRWRGVDDYAYASRVSDGVNNYLASNNINTDQQAG